MDYAVKYAKQVDERFSRASQAVEALNNDYEFHGVQSVFVYQIPTAPLNDYTRTGSNRYGTPSELDATAQELKVTQDRAFAFTIDRGNLEQTALALNAGQALDRQIREVVTPAFDTYVFKKLALAAQSASQSSTTAATANNAYSLFLAGQEALGDNNVPDTGRVCFCSYAFYNFLKQSPNFIRYGDASQRMLEKGIIGTVDGVKIITVPKNRLPATTGSGAANASFILTHPVAACGPHQLESYRIHENPPGISGYLIEGRVLYDCFVLSQKQHAVYYQGPAVSA